MPRLPAIKSEAIREIEVQQRFASRQALVRQIDRAEQLAAEIDPETTYPEDWIVYRITAYRPDMDTPALVVGQAIVRDMSALVERLCERAKLTIAELPAAPYDTDELCERWSVSRKTVERYRRRGLVARRLRRRDGRVCLGFTPSAVEAFEAQHAELLGDASRFTRISDRDLARALRRARRYAAVGFTLSQAAGRIALKLGRSREAVRLALVRHDDRAAEPIFRRRAKLEPADRRRIAAMLQRGERPRDITDRFERSRATIHRIANDERAETLRGLLPPPGAEPRPDHADDERLLSHPDVALGLGAPVELEAEAFTEAARAAPPVAAAPERARAVARRALIARASALVHAGAAGAEATDRAETDLRWASLLTVELVRALAPVILRAIEQRTARPLMTLPADQVASLLGAGLRAAATAVDRHHAERGGRLAATASVILARTLAAALPSPAPTTRAKPRHEGPIRLRDWTLAIDPWSAAVQPDERLRSHLPACPEDDARLIALRFGWSGAAPMTLDELGDAVGVTPAAFAAVLRRALARLEPPPG